MVSITLVLGPGSHENGIFPRVARINHSCIPNAHHHWNQNTYCETIYAVKDIEKDEEILISYINTFVDRATRLKKLKYYFNFDCLCDTCRISDPIIRKKSDLRRRILGNLETDIYNYDNDLHTVVQKIEQFYKFLNEEGIYTCSCDTGGPAFTAFQLILSKKMNLGINEMEEKSLGLWAKIAVDNTICCRGHFDGEFLCKEAILDYYSKH